MEADNEVLASYEHDFYQWAQHQAALLREGSLSDIDVAHLAEEVEEMGNNNYRALGSYVAVILMHLLKWQYQSDHRSKSWIGSICHSRDAIERLIEQSPSLVQKLPGVIPAEYRRARRKASRETGLSLSTFPEECPFTLAEIVEDFWPQ